MKIRQDDTHLVAPGAVVPSQGYRYKGHQWLLWQGILIHQIGAQSRCAHGRHDIVDRGAVGLAHGPNPFQAPGLSGETTGTGDFLVQHAARGMEDGVVGRVLPGLIDGFQQLFCHGGNGAELAARQPQQMGDTAPERVPALLACIPRQARQIPDWRHTLFIRVFAQHTGGHAHGRDTVHQGMMNLGVERKLPVFQTLGQVHFPHGPLPIHQVRMLCRYERQQLPNTPGRGQRLEAEMMLQVQVLIRHPYRLAQAIAQALVKGGGHLRFLPKLVCQLRDIVVRRALGEREQLEAAHMHGLLAFFQPEKELVSGVQGCHGAILVPGLCPDTTPLRAGKNWLW